MLKNIISDSSPLIIFGKINKFYLLEKIFKKIIISKAVFEEIVIRGKEKNAPEYFLLENYIKKGFIEIKELSKEYKKKADFLLDSNKNLDYGEAETICLALQEKEKFVLIDEKIARNTAEIYGLNPIGSFGVLLILFKRKILNESEIKEIVNKILKTNFRVSGNLIQNFWELIERLKNEKR